MLLLATLALAAVQHAHARDEEAEIRDHGAHVHGAAQIAAAADPDGRLVIDLQTPGDNVAGFERAPRDEGEAAALSAALERLADGAALFVFPDAAGCVFQGAELAVPANYGLSHTPREPELEPDATEGVAGVEQASREGGMEVDSANHAPQGYAASGHANLSAEYAFLCARPDRLTSIGVGLFEAFDGFEDIDIVFLDRTRQRSARLSPGQAVFDLR